jgi:FxsC-like protein
MITLDLAHRERLVPEWVTAHDHVVERIEEAFDRGKLVVVLVDAWSLGMKPHEKRVKRLDTRDYMNCVKAVLWNDRDPATVTARAELEAKLRVTLANKCARHGAHAFFARISSPDELNRRLSPALAKAAAHMREHLEVLRRAQGPQPSRPEIDGTGGAPL